MRQASQTSKIIPSEGIKPHNPVEGIKAHNPEEVTNASK